MEIIKKNSVLLTCANKNSINMENSLDDTEAHQSFRSPPRRRRSTFFERRDSVVSQPLSENVDADVCKKNTESNKRHNEMSRYYEKLLVEKEQWKREVNERRNKYHDLRQQYQMAIKAPSRSRMSYAALTNEDIEFLKAKPNISKLVDSQQKLHNSVKKTIEFVRRANQLEEVALELCEGRVNKVTEYILEHSTVEPIE